MAKKIFWRVLVSLGLVAILLLFLWRFSQAEEIPSPLTEVKDTIQKLKAIVSDTNLKSNSKKKERREQIRKLILERIDIDEMAKRSLGRHWRGRTESERAEYLKAFTPYIEYVYRNMVFESVEFAESATIRFLKERVDGEFAEVDLVIDSSPEDTKITFRLHLIDGHWKAYDVVIAGISQVQNLRSQFDRIISQSSFEEFLRRLREKNQGVG